MRLTTALFVAVFLAGCQVPLGAPGDLSGVVTSTNGPEAYSTRTVFHLEGGKENRPRVVKFQLRPDPLAR
jgi:hypothetical protein